MPAIVTLEGDLATASSPEGATASITVEQLFEQLGERAGSRGVVLPDGVKAVICREQQTIWVHQTPPRLFNLKWIANESPAGLGAGFEYRDITIALPYLIVLGVFDRERRGTWFLGDRSECFFRTEPLESLGDSLQYPALLNCSKFEPPEGHPLSWICTQRMDRSPWLQIADNNARMRVAFQALMHCLLETGFNYSSEAHEANSWYTESRGVDERISTVEAWEAASKQDPLFVLDVPWLPVDLSVAQVAERIANNARAGRRVSSADDVARHVFNHGAAERPDG